MKTKMSSKYKKNSVINRTTSETLRLGDLVLSSTATNAASLQPLTTATVVAASRKKIQNSSSSFQITGVTKLDFGDDSADDLDDISTQSHTDDISRVTDNETPSFSEDSRDTDDHVLVISQEPQETTVILQSEQAKKRTKNEIEMDVGARFKVVKMPRAKPFSKGRWTCFDYWDNSEKSVKVIETHSEKIIEMVVVNQIATKEIETKQDGLELFSNLIIDKNHKPATEPSNLNEDKDDLLSDIKVALSSTNCQSSFSGVAATCNYLLKLMTTEHQNLEGSPLKGSSSEDLPLILPNDDFNEATVFAVYCFIKKFVGSTPNNNNIDRKIEEALDAVKTHLMVAVHKEVDFLKTRVSTLEGRVNELEIENSILRVNYLLFKS